MTKRTFTVAFLATIAVAAIAAAFGHPVSIEGLASLGMFPLVTGEVEVSDIFATLKNNWFKTKLNQAQSSKKTCGTSSNNNYGRFL